MSEACLRACVDGEIRSSASGGNPQVRSGPTYKRGCLKILRDFKPCITAALLPARKVSLAGLGSEIFCFFYHHSLCENGELRHHLGH